MAGAEPPGRQEQKLGERAVESETHAGGDAATHAERRSTTRMKIAVEGLPFILVPLGSSVLGFVLGWWHLGIAAAGVAAFFVWFFRDPERHPPEGNSSVVAPADGKVVSIVKTAQAPLLDRPRLRVSIFMSPLDVHINRMPVTATIEEIRHQPGKFLAAYKDDAVEHNEQNAMRMMDPEGRRVAVVQVAGFLARRVVCKARKGDTYRKGERFGLIMFGSRTDLYLPPETAIEVKQGQKVKGGETVIGRFV